MMIHNLMLAMGNASGAGASSGSGMVQIGTIALMFGVFWFVLLRPQNKQRKEREAMLQQLKRGDKVITNGGLHATVRDVKDDIVVCDISDGVKVKISRQAVNTLMAED